MLSFIEYIKPVEEKEIKCKAKMGFNDASTLMDN